MHFILYEVFHKLRLLNHGGFLSIGRYVLKLSLNNIERRVDFNAQFFNAGVEYDAWLLLVRVV